MMTWLLLFLAVMMAIAITIPLLLIWFTKRALTALWNWITNEGDKTQEPN